MSVGLDRYRALLGVPGARRVALAGLLGQLPIGMGSVALVLAVVETTGSFSAAGLAVAIYSVASAGAAPFWGRYADRVGYRWVLGGTALGSLVLVAGLLVVLDVRGPTWAIFTILALAGISRPILTGALQSTWTGVARTEDERTTAYALHTTELGLAWVLGPLVVSVLIGAFGDRAGALVALGATAVVGAIGMAILATCDASRRRGRDRPEAAPGARLYTRAFVALLVPLLLLELATGAGMVTMTGFAAESGSSGSAGLLVALWAVGSILGGLWFGARTVARPLAHEYRRCLLALACGYVLLTLPTAEGQLAVALLAVGMTAAPAFTVQYGLMGDIAPEASRTEAFAWLDTLTAAGGAAGVALGGLTLEAAGDASAGFALAAACVFAAALMATLTVVPQRAPIAIGKVD